MERNLLLKIQYDGSGYHGWQIQENARSVQGAFQEALNGWIKEELYLDFGLETVEDVPKLLDEYVYYFNNRRPAAALGYKSPVQYKTELGF